MYTKQAIEGKVSTGLDVVWQFLVSRETHS